LRDRLDRFATTVDSPEEHQHYTQLKGRLDEYARERAALRQTATSGQLAASAQDRLASTFEAALKESQFFPAYDSAQGSTARADILACAAEYHARATELEAHVARLPKARQEACSRRPASPRWTRDPNL